MPIGEVASLIAALFWAFTSIAVRPVSTVMPALVLNACRSTVAGVMMLFLIPLAGDPRQTAPITYLVLFVAVIIGLGFGDSLYFEGIRLVGVARAMPITSAYPLFTTLIALIFLHEPLTPLMLVGIVTVVFGVYLVAQRGPLLSPIDLFRGESAKGTAMVALASLCWATGTVAMRPALQQIDFVLANVLRMPTAALLMWLLVWQRGAVPDLRKLKGQTLWLLVVTGAMTAISTLAFVGGVLLAGAAKASTLSSTAPLWAVPLSALFLREPVTRRVLVGTVLSVAGIWLLLSG